MKNIYHPSAGGADPGKEPTPEEVVKAGQSIHDRVMQLLAELPPGRMCPKCGMSMTHYRLKGYQCPRCD